MDQEPEIRMQAVMQESYGGPEQLEHRLVRRPSPGKGEVLVRVRTAGLNAADCFLMRGVPVIVRFMAGLFRPRPGIPGLDMAGEVVSVGDAVTRFQPGDAVFGCGTGTCAEYACAPASTLVHKPKSLPWEEAAAAPTAALAALHAMRDTARVQAGQQVLVIGASGGVGSVAVQLATRAGAEVTAVCSGQNADFVRSLGAHHIVDYMHEDLAARDGKYDVILDNIENRPLAECRRALKSGGMLILNSGTGASGLRFWVRLLKPLVMAPFLRQQIRRYVSVANAGDLEEISSLLVSGSLRVTVSRRYSLRETAAALAHIEAGHVRGKVVVSVDESLRD